MNAPSTDVLRNASQLESLAKQLGVRFLSAEELAGMTVDWSVINPAEARQRNVLSACTGDGREIFVLPDPLDNTRMRWLTFKLQRQFEWALASQADIRQRIDASAAESSSKSDHSREPSSSSKHSAVVAFVDDVIADAWRCGASDVHFETRRSGLIVKFRLDGVLTHAREWNGAEPPEEVLSRIKVLSELDIAERRVPQDGRFTRTLNARPVDFRVSVMPNAFGEDAVVRILDKAHLLGNGGSMSLDSLGVKDDGLKRMRYLASRPHDMLLVTGPTGSGKTTTLYAAISETLTGREKVITIEDPIEYELPGVLQIPVNERKGLTFSRGLRSILRHDPDTIFVGEIRDSETADIAVQSALTGHLVFTTVHANNVFDVIGRFIHMGVDMFSFMSALNGVVSQRLVRKVCKACCEPDPLHEGSEGRRAESKPGSTNGYVRARGCDQCRGTGYLGRTVINEVLVIDDHFRQLVMQRAEIENLKRYAIQLAGCTIEDAAMALLANGSSTHEEVARVVGIA